MQKLFVQWPWMRLVAYALIIIAVLVLGGSLGGYIYRQSSEASALPAEDLAGDLAGDLALDAPTADVFDPLEPTPVAENPSAAPALSQMMVVYISGAVASPGTYRLEANTRIDDVVRLAGGLTADVDRDKINLSDYIHDAQHIHIVRLGETESPATGDPQVPEANGGLINLNTASASELESLDGIGKVLAQRIVDWRTTNGPFASPDDLMQVKGVTASIYEEIKDKITVG